MNKWEEEYKELKAGNLDKKLKGLQELVNSKSANKEQYTEYKKYSAIKENMSKIENILEYRNLQKQKIKKIDEVLAKRSEIKQKEDEIREQQEECEEIERSFVHLEVEINALADEKDKLTKELKTKGISEEQKEEIMVKLLSIQEKFNSNNDKYVEKQKTLSDKKQNIKNVGKTLENSKKSVEKFGNISEEEINKTKMEISQKVSKCNMIAKNLLSGRSWDYIDMRLDNWQDKRMTSKTKLTEVAQKVTAKQEKGQNVENKGTIQNDPANKGVSLQKVSDFDIKHPRLAKIKNWFKSIFVKEKTETTKGTDKEESNVIKKDEEFKKFIKEIAEKGMKQVEQENAEKAKQEVKKRFAENKKAAHQRETEKYGKEYADKSVNVDEISDDGVR